MDKSQDLPYAATLWFLKTTQKIMAQQSLFPVILQDKDWTVEKSLSFWQRIKNMFEEATNFLNKHFRISQK